MIDKQTRRIEQYADTINTLAYIWGGTESQKPWYDALKKTWVARDYKKTYRALFGTWWPLRNSSLGSMVKVMGRLVLPDRWDLKSRFKIHIPPDAVIFCPVQGGVVVVSKMSQKAVKIVQGTTRIRQLGSEIRAYKIAVKAGIEQHVPPVLDWGRTGGSRWICTQFAPNTNPIGASIYPFTEDRYELWLSWLEDRVLPLMKQFYTESGIEFFEVGSWVADHREQLISSNAPRDLWDLWKLVEQAGLNNSQNILPVSLIHGDLLPNHVHRDEVSWRLIDWGASLRGPLLFDLLRIFSVPPYASTVKQKHWKWLKGTLDTGDLPREIRDYVQSATEWVDTWLNLHLVTSDVRFHLLAGWLQASLKTWEEEQKLPTNKMVALNLTTEEYLKS